MHEASVESGGANAGTRGWIARYAPNLVLGRHAHDRGRLCIVLSGRFEEEENGHARTNFPGWLLYRPAGMQHSERFDGAGAACALFTPGRGWTEAASECRVALTGPLSIRTPEVERIGLALRHELGRPDDYSAIACEAAAWECLVLLARRSPDDRASPASLARAIDFLRDNLSTPPAIARIAEIAGVHPSTLSRQFRRAFGKSVMAYARSLRVERSVTLLRETSVPIAEIALICGFSSQAHLTTMMRKTLGVTPARLRRLRRG